MCGFLYDQRTYRADEQIAIKAVLYTGIFGAIKQSLHSARKIEIFLLIAAAAIAALIFISGDNDTTGNDLEIRTEEILECIGGVGKTKVVINSTAEGEIKGVLIVAEGAGSIRTYLEMQKAVSTLLGIDINNIEIIEMGD